MMPSTWDPMKTLNAKNVFRVSRLRVISFLLPLTYVRVPPHLFTVMNFYTSLHCLIVIPVICNADLPTVILNSALYDFSCKTFSSNFVHRDSLLNLLQLVESWTG